jgi:hypothetical protein
MAKHTAMLLVTRVPVTSPSVTIVPLKFRLRRSLSFTCTITQPIPCHEECHFDTHGNTFWTLLIDAEQEALAKLTSDRPPYYSSLIAIRVSGFLLKDVWNNARRWNLGDTSYSNLIKKINAIRRSEEERWFGGLVELGLVYRSRLFRMCE